MRTLQFCKIIAFRKTTRKTCARRMRTIFEIEGKCCARNESRQFRQPGTQKPYFRMFSIEKMNLNCQLNLENPKKNSILKFLNYNGISKFQTQSEIVIDSQSSVRGMRKQDFNKKKIIISIRVENLNEILKIE